jgi:hypothetical protein
MQYLLKPDEWMRSFLSLLMIGESHMPSRLSSMMAMLRRVQSLPVAML